MKTIKVMHLYNSQCTKSKWAGCYQR